MGSEKSSMNGNTPPHNGDRAPGYLDDANAREIEADIDRTRRHMDETLDQLGERLSPHHLVDDVLDFMKAKGRAINSESVTRICMKSGKHLGHFVKDHPGPALMAGAGIFWYFLEWSRQGQPRSHIESVEPRGIEIEKSSAIIYDPYDELSVGVSERRMRPIDEAEVGGIELSFEEETGPGMAQRIKEKTGRAAERVGEIGSNIKESVSDSASSVADKVGMVGSRIKQGAEDTAHRTGEKLDELGHRMSMKAHRTGEKLDELGHRVSMKAHRAADRASELGQRTMSKMKYGAHAAAEKVEHLGGKVSRGVSRGMKSTADRSVKLGHWVEHRVEDIYHESDRKVRQAFDESPLAVGLAVAGLGLLFGALMPSTRVEDKAIGDKAEDLRDNLRVRGEELKRTGEETARKVVHAASSQAKRAGLTPTHVLETIQHVVADVKDAAVDALGEAIVDIQDAAEQALEDERLDADSLKQDARSVVDAARDELNHVHSPECGHIIRDDDDNEKF